MKESSLHSKPPKWADTILAWYCSEQYFEEVQGDLHEWFYQRVTQQGLRKARLMYFIDVIRYFRSFRLKSTQKINKNSNYLFMKSLFKITFRNLRRDGLSAILRIGNLSMGIIIFLLTLVYAKYELNYDTYHDDHEHIFRLAHSLRGNPWAATPLGMGATALDISPEIDKMTRVFPGRETTVKRGDVIFKEKNAFVVDSAFFEVFTHKAIDGNLNEALIEPSSIVLTEKSARKYFGDENPVGQSLEIGDGPNRIVSAVIEDVPEQSHLQFDFLIPMSTFSEDFGRAWRNWATYTYVKLFDEANVGLLKSRLIDRYEQRYDAVGEEAFEILLTPVAEIHLRTNHEKEMADNGNINYVYVLLSVGFFVLLISCINFVNISVIKGLDRGKEVGLRKTVGASKNQVIAQFLGENLIVILLSAVIGLLGLALLAPYFKNFSDLDLPLNVLQNTEVILIVLALVIVLELICGVYPAMVLSRFKPVQILKIGAKGGMRNSRLGFLRKGLIILQFGISIVLIVSSLLIYNQLDYIQNKEMGLEKDQIILIGLQGKIQDDFRVFRDALENITGVKSIATSSHVPGYRIMVEGAAEIGIDRSGENLTHRMMTADDQLVVAYGLELVEGRNFNENLSEGITEYLINESAVDFIFQDRDPLTRQLVWEGDTGRVVGILKDFNFQSLHNDVEPLVISSNTWWRNASIRFDPRHTEAVVNGIERVGRELFPNEPSIEYEFLSDRFASMYKAESKLKSIVWIFCMISIILTISGIFGMATYIARQRTREIAIRKVLGSNMLHLFNLMSKDFVVLLIVSLLIAVPSAYYLSNWWLQDFAYQVSIGTGIFVLAALGTFLLVLMSSGFVTRKAIKANPTEALKSE